MHNGSAPKGCNEILALLKAAEDSRSVRSVVPSADPAAFLAGNTQGQRKVRHRWRKEGSSYVHHVFTSPWQVVLQQAHVAGVQAADPTQDAGGSKLLDEALALGKAYGVASAWEVRSYFVLGLLSVPSAKMGEASGVMGIKGSPLRPE